MENFTNYSKPLTCKLIAKRDELNKFSYFFPTIMSASPERALYYRITRVLMFRYSVTHKSNTITYRPYTVAFNLSNQFTTK